MFQLRPYQAEAKQAIPSAWDEGYRITLLVPPPSAAGQLSPLHPRKTRHEWGNKWLISDRIGPHVYKPVCKEV